MNPTNTALAAAIYADGLTPQMVEHVSDNEMYVGYCSPGCTGVSDTKWFIKRIFTNVAGVQTMWYAGGSRQMNKAWSLRKTYAYAPTEAWAVSDIDGWQQPTEEQEEENAEA